MADPMLRGIVRIAGGAGFVVSADGHIATCAHVVEDKKLGNQVQIAFHATGKVAFARVEILDEASDVAILRLESPLPEAVTPLHLGSSAAAKGRTFETFGFPNAKPVEGMAGRCEVIGETTQQGFPVLQLRAGEITHGYSGAPVWDSSLQVVIGIVASAITQDEFGKQGETAFIIPVETLRDVFPTLHLKDICPYRGLAAFTEKDADFFFGRETLVNDLISYLRAYPRFLAIVGPSGSGKSSVVQAGLIPALRHGVLPDSQNWRIVVSRPSSDPYANDAWRTATCGGLPTSPPTCRLVLFIDQFEELFALCTPEMRARFVEDLHTLIEGPASVTVMLTLRGDFYGHLQQSLLGEYLPYHQVNVDRIAIGDLRAAIERPANRVGLHFESGLVDMIAEETYRADHTLPLLQSALTQLWGQQENGQLTYTAYQKVGRVTGALGLWADDTYRKLSREEQNLAQRIFTRLVHYGKDARGDTRQRMLLHDLAAGLDAYTSLHELVRQMATARLLVTDGNGDTETVEIIHDALLQEWGQLQEWVNKQREFRLWQQRLDTQMRMWKDKKLDEGALLRGALLVEAERWMEDRGDDLLPEQLGFIQASTDKRKQEHAAQERLQRRITAGLVTGMLVLSVLSFVAWGQRNTAKQQRNIALARQWAAVGQLEFESKGTFISTVRGIESLHITPSLEGDQLLRRGLSLLSHQITRVQHNDKVLAVAFSPDGRWVVSGSRDGTARVWEAATGTEIARMQHDDVVNVVAFSPDGRWVISGSTDGTARVWEAATGVELTRMQHTYYGVNTMALSPDGRWVVSGNDSSGAIRVWETTTGTELIHVQHGYGVNTVAFSPDGQWVVSGSCDNTVQVWEAATGTEIARMQHDDVVNAVAFSPDGQRVASGSQDGTAIIWEAETGTEMARVQHDRDVNVVAFSPDGRQVVSGSQDGTAIIWEAATGTEMARVQHDRDVNVVAFSPDGRWVVSGSADGTVRVWKATTGSEVSYAQHNDKVLAVAFSPDGRWVVSGSADGTARVWDISPTRNTGTATGAEVVRVKHNDRITALAFSPDSQRVVSGSWDNTARVWETATGVEVSYAQHDYGVNTVVFSPDGQWVASGSDGGEIRVWETATGVEVARMQQDSWQNTTTRTSDGRWVPTYDLRNREWLHSLLTKTELTRPPQYYGVNTVAFSPNGQWVVSGGREGIAGAWEAATGEMVGHTWHDGEVFTVAFSPNGRWVVSGGGDGTAQVWHCIGGELARVQHGSNVKAVAFSPNSQKVASGSDDGTVIVWEIPSTPRPLTRRGSDGGMVIVRETATVTKVARMQHDGQVNAVAFSPDGRWIASGSEDSTAIVWETTTGKKVARLQHDDGVSTVAFSPDGQWVVSGSKDNTVRVWETSTGTEVARMQHDGWVNAVAFSPDGRWIASGSWDCTARVWLWRPEDLIAEACAHLPRNFTREEWQQYMGDEPYRATCPNLPIPEE